MVPNDPFDGLLGGPSPRSGPSVSAREEDPHLRGCTGFARGVFLVAFLGHVVRLFVVGFHGALLLSALGQLYFSWALPRVLRGRAF